MHLTPLPSTTFSLSLLRRREGMLVLVTVSNPYVLIDKPAEWDLTMPSLVWGADTTEDDHINNSVFFLFLWQRTFRDV